MITDQDIEKLKAVFATKEDLKGFATKEDFRVFATKEDLDSFAKKDDLRLFSTKDDLKHFATKDDLKNFATKDDLKHFTTKDDLNQLRQDFYNYAASKQDLEEHKIEMRAEFNKLRNEMLDRFDQVYTELKALREEQMAHAQRHEDLETDIQKIKNLLLSS